MPKTLTRFRSLVSNGELDRGTYADSEPDGGEDIVVIQSWSTDTERLALLLDHYGIAYTFADEVRRCDECYNYCQTNPTHYGWSPDYTETEHGELTCDACLAAHYTPEDLEDLGHLNNPSSALFKSSPLFPLLEQHGFTRHPDDKAYFESGYHPGQTDDPHKIASTVPDTHDFLFVILSTGQFDIRFALYTRPTNYDHL